MTDRSKLIKKPDVFDVAISNPAAIPAAPTVEEVEAACGTPSDSC